MNEREYDRINNEGGEGYNPYREEKKRKEFEAHKEWTKTRAGRKDAIYTDLERKDCSIARECGTYNQAEIDGLRAQLAEIEAEEEAEFIAAWPLETTKARRVDWNNFIRSIMDSNGRISPDKSREIYRRQGQQGWTMDDLKKAVKHHNL